MEGRPRDYAGNNGARQGGLEELGGGLCPKGFSNLGKLVGFSLLNL